MKRQATIGFWSVVLGWVMLSAPAGMAQAPADTNAILILKTAQPVKVDGVLDEDCWKQAVPVKADHIKGEEGKISAEPRMVAKYAWDDRYLYIAYEIFDTNLVAQGNGAIKGPADNRREGCEISPPDDVAEFFIGFGDSNMFWEVHHNASNQFNDILVFAGLPGWQKDRPEMARCNIYWAKNEYIQDDKDHKLAWAAQVKPRADGKPSTVNDGADTDAGYTAELRFPWAGIGAPSSAKANDGWKKMAGREIVLLAVTENGDFKDQPYFTSCPTMPKADFFHNHFVRWPRYKLAAEAPAK
jgi:hypothetical protein